MKTSEEIKTEIDRIRTCFANRNVASQDYVLDGWLYKSRHLTLEWILGEKHCFICGNIHTNKLMTCSEKCSKKLYG